LTIKEGEEGVGDEETADFLSVFVLLFSWNRGLEVEGNEEHVTPEDH